MDGRFSCNHLFILHTIVNSGSGGGGGRRGGGRRGGGGDGGGGGGRKIVLLHGGYWLYVMCTMYVTRTSSSNLAMWSYIVS